MTVKELIELLKDLEPDKEISIEGCGCVKITDEGDFYDLEFWYESPKK